MAALNVCTVCGRRFEQLDRHAPALEENFLDLRADVCSGCHNGPGGLTRRAYDAGMLKDHSVEARRRMARKDSERLWYLAQGSGDLLAAMDYSYARATDNAGMERNARTAERLGPMMARLSYLLDATEGGPLPAVLGSEPAKNRRRAKQHPFRKLRRAAGVVSVRRVFGMLRYLQAMSKASSAMLRANPNSSVGETLARSEDRSRVTLEALLDHPIPVVRGLAKLIRSHLGGPFMDTIERLATALDERARVLQTAPEDRVAMMAFPRMAALLVSIDDAMRALITGLAAGVDPVQVGGRFVATFAELQL